MRRGGRRRMGWQTAFGALLALAIAQTACGAFEETPPRPTPVAPPENNLLRDPGFEDGSEPWTFRDQPEWQPFTVSDTLARGGARSMKLELRGDESYVGTLIAGGLQTVQAAEFPEFLSGYYRVQTWKPAAPFQYLQFVVTVRGSDLGTGNDLDEIRFPIAGIDRDPFTLANSRFRFLSRDAPDMGTWTYFAYPLRYAFLQHYGKAPTQWDEIEVFFEVRFDGKEEGATSSADVYFDDLYLGTQALNPNRPDDD